MKLLFLELASLAGFANAVLYIGGFFRRMENDRQAEASGQNTRLSLLEGKVDALINSGSFPPSTSKSCDCPCHNKTISSSLKDLEGDYTL